MKVTALFLSLTSLCSVCSALPAFMAYNIPIIPGEKIGKIYIGESRKAVVAEMGKADSTQSYSPNVLQDRWQAKEVKSNSDRGPAVTKVTYKDEVVIQIEVTSGLYSTYQGISTDDTFEEVRRQYPTLKVRAFNYAKGQDLSTYYHYDELKRGIAFKKSVASMITNDSQPDSIIVTRIGVGSLPDIGGKSGEVALDKTFNPGPIKPRKLVKPQLNTQQRKSAQNALKALKRLESAVNVGLTYRDYQGKIVNAQVGVDESLRVLPQSDLRNELERAMNSYLAARTYWGYVDESPSVERVFGPMRQDSWKSAFYYTRNIEQLLK